MTLSTFQRKEALVALAKHSYGGDIDVVLAIYNERHSWPATAASVMLWLRSWEQATEATLLNLKRVIDFYDDHALGPKAQPSCLVCGQVLPPAIKHMELPGIIVCHKCVALAKGDQP